MTTLKKKKTQINNLNLYFEEQKKKQAKPKVIRRKKIKIQQRQTTQRIENNRESVKAKFCSLKQ